MTWEAFCSWENLWLAWRRASRGKRGGAAVARFEHRLEDQLLSLLEELRSETWRPGRYVSFSIHEPKRRLISAAPFRDRVVHHMLCQVIEPAFERSFIATSFANRVGRGTHRALRMVQREARHRPYVLQCDLRQFFPSIDHDILRGILYHKVSDPRLRQVVALILASGEGLLTQEYDMVWFPGDDLLAATRPRGLPIGNLTSQFWANCLLNPFDHFVKRELRCPAYVRYVDDFMLFSDSKNQLWEWKAAVERRLAALRLTMHSGSHPRPVTEGIPFLGFITWPDHRRLKSRKGWHFRRAYRALLAELKAGRLPPHDITARVQAWVNHVRFANTIGLRKAILGDP